jgi:hypothetical protein
LSEFLQQPVVELDTAFIRVTEGDDGVSGNMGSVDDTAKEELSSGAGADLVEREISFVASRRRRQGTYDSGTTT